MAVKYKKNGTWYDISSSSNNAVDAVENGNLNPVTSNAVYDILAKSESNATLSSSSTDGSITCQKSGNVVTVFTSGSQGQVAGNWSSGWNAIATIPEGYRPTRAIGGNWSSPRSYTSSTLFASGNLYITSAGVINLHLSNTLTDDDWVSFNISYVI